MIVSTVAALAMAITSLSAGAVQTPSSAIDSTQPTQKMSMPSSASGETSPSDSGNQEDDVIILDESEPCEDENEGMEIIEPSTK